MSFFNEINLKTLVFKDGREAYNMLKHQAHLEGFDIFSRYNINIPHSCYYCHKGRKTQAKSNKTGCPFYIRMKPIDPKRLNEGISISKYNLTHNHLTDTTQYYHENLSIEQRSLLISMYLSGISYRKIQKFIFRTTEMYLSTYNLGKIIHEKEINNFSKQTDELIHLMERDGFSFVFQHETDQQINRIGILTINHNELNNLKKYGDVIQMDGTSINLENRWYLIPITLLDENRHLVSGGMFFCAIITEEVIIWLLNIILDELGLKTNLQTIITDEDASFVPAIRKIQMERNNNIKIHHVICALHKTKNWNKKLHKTSLSKDRKQYMKKLFARVCYSDSIQHVNDSLRIIKSECNELDNYISKHIEPMLIHFSRGFLTHVFTLGYNTTSIAESMNQMIKNGMNNRLLSLYQARLSINDTLEFHHFNCLHKSNVKRIERLEIEFNQSFTLSSPIRELIRREIDKASNCLVERCEFGYIVIDIHHIDFQYLVNFENECSCGLVNYLGIPCAHIIACNNNLDLPFPLESIKERWIIQNESECEKAKENQSLYKSDDHNNPENMIQNNFVAEESSQKERYLELFYKFKEIASIAARSPENTFIISQMADNTLDGLLNGSLENNNLRIKDAVDALARKVGRPKKTLFSKS